MSSRPSAPSTTSVARLPPPLLFARLAAVAVVAPYLVRAGLPRLQRWIEPTRTPRPIDPGDSERVEDQMAAWVDGIIRRGHPFVRRGCLTRGVTLYYTLRREGDDVSLCFGVGTENGETVGHCWLDKAGEPLLERADPLSIFTEVVRLTPDGVSP